jgi:hypothetical protein
MADVNVNDGLTIEEAAVAYEVGAGIGTMEPDVIAKDLYASTDNVPFFVNASVGGSVGVHTIKDAPGSGNYIYLIQITVMSSDKNVIRIGSGDHGGWVENVIFGPYAFNTEVTGAGFKVGTQYTLELKQPVRLPANKALTADVDAAGYTLITAEGFVN